jgi:hypothetical protein
MLGIFGIFGRSQEMQRFHQAHPPGHELNVRPPGKARGPANKGRGCGFAVIEFVSVKGQDMNSELLEFVRRALLLPAISISRSI